MKGERKPFDQETYDKNDGPGKMAAKRILESCYPYLSVEVQSEDGGIDMIGRADGRFVYGYEVGVKKGWGDTWPDRWRTVDVEERKKKNHGIFYFIITLNRPMDQCWMISYKSLQPERLLQKETYLELDEYFYNVPLAECRILP